MYVLGLFVTNNLYWKQEQKLDDIFGINHSTNCKTRLAVDLDYPLNSELGINSCFQTWTVFGTVEYNTSIIARIRHCHICHLWLPFAILASLDMEIIDRHLFTKSTTE